MEKSQMGTYWLGRILRTSEDLGKELSYLRKGMS